MKGILGRKIGMTQVFTTDGLLIPVTVIEATDNVVLQKKTVATDGYDAVKVGFEDKREKLANKAEQGIAKKANTAPKRFIKEFRLDEMMSYEVGDSIKVDSFVAGEVVDVTGTSKGKGYQGVIKRHGQSIGPKGHGSGAHRIVGSMGPIAPNRIAPGKHLPGQTGNVTVTIQNLEVVAVDTENNLLLIKGSVPGPVKGMVVVKSAIKGNGAVKESHELVDLSTKEETPVEEAAAPVEETAAPVEEVKEETKDEAATEKVEAAE
ncbi:MAG: 50S ribosomal protein L3 [Thomasclavelia sp.]|jgi:large subunit ribosomal protein L3|nr:50S ribosomal protein L3 [Thomasclavelia sp.]